MNKTDILQQVEAIFKDVLDEENITLTEGTNTNEVDGGDSLAHIQLIVAIEKHFNINFTSKEVFSWKNVGEMVDVIGSKIS